VPVIKANGDIGPGVQSRAHTPARSKEKISSFPIVVIAKGNEQQEKLEYNRQNKHFAHLSTDYVLQLQDAFPTIAVPEQIGRAELWLAAHQERDKGCNYEQFLLVWMQKAAERLTP